MSQGPRDGALIVVMMSVAYEARRRRGRELIIEAEEASSEFMLIGLQRWNTRAERRQ